MHDGRDFSAGSLVIRATTKIAKNLMRSRFYSFFTIVVARVPKYDITSSVPCPYPATLQVTVRKSPVL